MSKPIEAVFLDIDGTLVVDGHLIPSAVEAVERVRQKGIPVMLCTGRSPLHTRKIQAALKVQSGVYFNGGLAMMDNQVIASTPLSVEVFEEIAEFCSGHRLPVVFHTHDQAVVPSPIPKEFEPVLKAYDFPPTVPMDAVDWEKQTTHVYQANVFIPKPWDPAFTAQFPECLLYRWDDRAVDLQKRGCDKSIGATAVLKRLGIPLKNALHIGDGGNDIGLFQIAGTSVAMGNASDEVKQHAQMVTTNAEQDGVYQAFSKIGLI